ncbi:MAG TPA: YCF48-related protein [Malonomonas sp.]
MQAESTGQAAPPSADGVQQPLLSVRLWSFLAAVLLLLISTVIAFNQNPHPNPLTPLKLTSSDYWRYPLERNAFKRLPLIDANLNDLFLLPGTELLWAVGSGGMILHSSDGGRSWSEQSLEPASQQGAQTQSSGFAWPAVARAAEAPATSKQQYLEPIQQQQQQQQAPPQETAPEPRPAVDPTVTNLNSVYFVDAEYGWIVGANGLLLRTTDGGKRWLPQVNDSRVNLRSVYFADRENGWAVGAAGVVLHSSTGGEHWERQSSRATQTLAAVFFLNEATGWAVGDRGLIMSTGNAGKDWQAQRSGTDIWLAAIDFVDAEHGWAVGGGVILHTENGGQSWQEQKSGFPPFKFTAVDFIDRQRGWVVASRGELLVTVDGGRSWEMPKPLQEPLAAVQFVDAERGWVAGANGALYQTEDAGRHWTTKSRGAGLSLLKIQFVDAQHGWAIGKNGRLLRTTDAGQNWQPFDCGSAAELTDGFFTDADNGWLVGSYGTILRTRNAGSDWQQQKSGTDAGLQSVHFVNNQLGWAVGRAGTVLKTSDAGQSWQPLAAGEDVNYTAVYFADERHGWLVTSGGEILQTGDAGDSWQVQRGKDNKPLTSIRFIDPARGWAIGSHATLKTIDGGSVWQGLESGTGTRIEAQWFANRSLGWLVGWGGTILKTEDGGQTWQPQISGTSAILRSVQFLDANQGWAVGGGTILRTLDGGRSWTDPLTYRRCPAPWYYLSWLLAGLLLLSAVRRPAQVVAAQQSVADMLVSDKPLEAGEPDALNFGLIARGLSRYLRNENTQPPLTIAITGEWGTGKSSMMNLLKADLQSYGVRPVWFNAWHHQKESNLLASLLDNIRTQAVPRWWSVGGLHFRLRLLQVRGWRNCLPLVALLFVCAVSAGIASHHASELKTINLKELLDLPFSPVGIIESLFERSSLLTFSASSLALFVAVLKGFVAFGLDPKKLIPTIPGRLQVKNLNVELSFRQKFSSEFKDVTRALQPRTMLILIDDLDRCKAEHVLEILETINYLVTSGACYVVLGMARERVERCIGAAFKEVAEDMIDDPAGEEVPSNNGRKKRVEFARQYLEKLINIEVPVPVASAGQSRLLLAPDPVEPVRPSLWQQCYGLLFAMGKKLFPWLLVGLVLWGGFWLGEKNAGDLPQKVTVVTAPETGVPAEAEQTPSPGDERPAPPPTGETQPATFTPGQTAAYPKWLLGYPLLALLAAGVVLLVRRPDYQVQDSPEFVRALQVWHPLIATKRNTPRAIKRFLNRVRYFAMINRDQPEAEKWSLWSLLKKSQQQPVEDTEPMLEEATLVAIGALHHLHPRLVNDDQLFAQLTAGTDLAPETLQLLGLPAAIATVLRGVLKEHEKIFGRWSCTEDERAIFLEISQGIQIL